MNRRLSLLLLPLIALVAGQGLVDLLRPLPAAAQPPPLAAAGEGDDPAAVLLLARAEAAAARLGWSGTEYAAAWGPSGGYASVLDVEHLPGLGTTARPHGADAAGATAAYAPDPAGAATGAVAGPGAGAVDRLVSAYRVVERASDTVDGRAAVVVAVERSDGSLVARLWIDPHCALTLRREVYTADGIVAHSSVLTDVVLAATSGAPADGAAADLGAGQARPPAGDVPSVVAGAYALSAVAQLSGGVQHLTYTDGLSSVSVFRQDGHLDVHALAGATPHHMGGAEVYGLAGLPARLTWEGSGHVYTVVSDAPADALAAVVAAFPHTAVAADPGDGLTQRLWRGAGRLTAWLNPFD